MSYPQAQPHLQRRPVKRSTQMKIWWKPSPQNWIPLHESSSTGYTWDWSWGWRRTDWMTSSLAQTQPWLWWNSPMRDTKPISKWENSNSWWKTSGGTMFCPIFPILVCGFLNLLLSIKGFCATKTCMDVCTQNPLKFGMPTLVFFFAGQTTAHRVFFFSVGMPYFSGFWATLDPYLCPCGRNTFDRIPSFCSPLAAVKILRFPNCVMNHTENISKEWNCTGSQCHNMITEYIFTQTSSNNTNTVW